MRFVKYVVVYGLVGAAGWGTAQMIFGGSLLWLIFIIPVGLWILALISGLVAMLVLLYWPSK